MNSKRYSILGIGEILWDMLPGGKKPGGAVGNFIYFCNILGCEGRITSSVGDDGLGAEIIEHVKNNGMDSSFLQVDPDHPTGTVDVKLDNAGKPEYVIHENVAWDFIRLKPGLLEFAQNADALCFGSLGQRSAVSRESIQKAVNNAQQDALIMCDINLRQDFYSREIINWSCEAADIIKLNDEELPVIGNLLGMYGNDEGIAEGLIETFNLDLVALTRGDKGSVLFTQDGISEHPGIPAEVVDSVGAGDAFAAAVMVGLLEGRDLDTINDRANIVASYVCSQTGPTPEVPEEVISYQ